MPARVFPLRPGRRTSGRADRGLTSPEVAARRARYGRNDVRRADPSSLVGARRATRRATRCCGSWSGRAPSTRAIGDAVEAATLAVAIVPLALMDAYLHRRTSASTEGLRSRLAARARVVRDGGEIEIAAAEVVPGDLVIVAAGELVPADGVIVAGDERPGRRVDADRRVGAGAEACRSRAPPAMAPSRRVAGRALGLRRDARARGAGAPPRRVHRRRDALRRDRARGGGRRHGADARSSGRSPTWSRVLTGVAAAACVALALVRLRAGLRLGRRARERGSRSRSRHCPRSFRSSSRSSSASASIGWRAVTRSCGARRRSRTSAGSRPSAPTRPGR